MYICMYVTATNVSTNFFLLFSYFCSLVAEQAGRQAAGTVRQSSQSLSQKSTKFFSFCIFYIHFNIECKYLSQILHFFAGATHTISAYTTTTAAAIIHISCGRRVVRELCTHVLISRNAFKFIYKLIKQQLQRYIHTHGFF